VADLAGDAHVVLADGTLGKRPFLAALASSGLGLKESYRVLKAIGKVRNMNHTSPADAFHLAKDKATGHVVAFEYASSLVDVVQARDEGGVLVAKKLDLHLDTKTVAHAVTIAGDLKASLVKAGFAEEIAPKIEEALEGHVDLADVKPGTRLLVVATEQRLLGSFLRYASIDALEVTSTGKGVSPVRVYHFPPFDPEKGGGLGETKKGGFYDAKGQEPYKGGWRIPVPGARIASRFNPHRMHPTLHVIMPHNGVDFAAPTGTPIYAAASGTVKTVGDSGPCGNMVQIEHGSGDSLVSSYCHMSKFAPGLRVGQRVEAKQLLGYVGQTGRATGPHLHFAIKKNGVFIDPLAMKLDGVRVVPPSSRDEFEELKGRLDKELDALRKDAAPLPTWPDGSEGDAGPPGVDAAADAAPEEIFDDPAIP
jgi:murein DD-endopeptidase MepM/ murein hydrolase activator NlpD